MDHDAAVQDISELFAVMGRIGFRLLSGGKRDENRLHLIALGGGYDPAGDIAGAVGFLKAFVRLEDDLLLPGGFKEIGRRCSEAFDQIEKRNDGGGYLTALQL